MPGATDASCGPTGPGNFPVSEPGKLFMLKLMKKAQVTIISFSGTDDDDFGGFQIVL